GTDSRTPAHPYPVCLRLSVPRRGQRKDHGPLPVIPGFLPRPDDVGAGCVFASRCPLEIDKCRTSEPPLFTVEPGRVSRCYRWTEAENGDGTAPPSFPAGGRSGAVDDGLAAAPGTEPADAGGADAGGAD